MVEMSIKHASCAILWLSICCISDALDLPEWIAADDECSASVSDTFQSASCGLSMLQLKTRLLPTQTAGSLDDAGCHDAVSGDKCMKEIQWALKAGIADHPEWFPGVNHNSSLGDVQHIIWTNSPSKCPRPCGTPPMPPPWCLGVVPPTLWRDAPTGPPMKVKLLSYNLFWWHLFGVQNGNHDSAGKLINQSMGDEPYDIMGFQECEDPERVLGAVGLLEDYEVFNGTHAVCMAYRKSVWTLMDHGLREVAEDMPTKYYGTRGAQWMRLRHIETGKIVFFVNHHGPLSVNSGGLCGGEATANNLVEMMGTLAQVGDVLILVGDFNANAASETVQFLWRKLTHVHHGVSFGGVDNIFSNINPSSVLETNILGKGGSDHDAISAVIQVPPPDHSLHLDSLRSNTVSGSAAAAHDLIGAGASGDAWDKFWCGRMDMSTAYVVSDGWSKIGPQGDPENCCRDCQRDTRCKAFVWKIYGSVTRGPQCELKGGIVLGQLPAEGIVSGLPAIVAAAKSLSIAAAVR